jgi:hypothetical protein
VIQRILRQNSDDPEGLYFSALLLRIEEHHEEAWRILHRLRNDIYRGLKCPYLLDLATEAQVTKHWNEAIECYQEILDDAYAEPEVRSLARRSLDELYYENLPQLQLKSDGTKLSSGTILRNSLKYGMPIDSIHRWSLLLNRDDLSQEASTGIRKLDEERMEAETSIRSQWTADWLTEFGVGDSSAGILASSEVAYYFESQTYLSMDVDYQKKAVDSLSLELLDGRQNQVALLFYSQLWNSLSIIPQATVRQVDVAGEPLGEGFQFQLQMEQLVFPRPIQISVGYQGEYSGFSRSNTHRGLLNKIRDFSVLDGATGDPLDELIDDSIHRHSITVSFRGKVLSVWTYDFTSVMGYAVDRSLFEHGFLVGSSLWLRKSIELRWEGGYFSNGNKSNQGSESFQLSLALKTYF